MNNQNFNPSINSNSENNNENLIDMETLIVNLKREDLRNLKMMNNMKWMYFALIIVYALFFLVNPDPELKLHHRITGLSIVLAFIYLAIVFRRYHKEYREIDYSLPLLEMLSRAANRYKLTFKNYLLLAPPLLLIDLGVTISFYHRLLSYDPINRVLFTQVVYFTIIFVSGFIGYIIWRNKQKPLRDCTLQMLMDLNRDVSR